MFFTFYKVGEQEGRADLAWRGWERESGRKMTIMYTRIHMFTHVYKCKYDTC
jgi:hypothetical protein